VGAVDAVIAKVAAAVVEEPAPVGVEPVWVEGADRRGSERQVVIDALGRGRVGFVGHGRLPGALPAAGPDNLADGAGAYAFTSFCEVAAAARLNPDLHHTVVAAGSGKHRLALAQVVAGGFLDVDVLAGLAGEDGGNGVPVVRGADHDGIDG